MELNRIIPMAREQGVVDFPVDPRLIQLLDVDVQISCDWIAYFMKA
jgi:hypothetical protein